MSREEGTESNPYSTILYLLQLRYHLLITSSLSLLMASDSSSSKWVMENGDIPHVLAVDDNIIDRTLVEKHLKNSSCKGTYTYLSLNHFMLYSFLLTTFTLH